MKRQVNAIGKGMKSVRDLLSDGLKQGHIFLKTLGDTTHVKLKRNKLKVLKRAIGEKDYYQIKSILFSSFKIH